MKSCPSCKSDLADNARACPKCGHDFHAATHAAGAAIIWYVVIAILIVIAIPVAYLAWNGMAQKITRRGEEAKIAQMKQAQTDISTLGTALGAFEVDNGRFPTSSEGLGALSTAPGGLTNWHGPYIERAVVNDPWGNPYVYTCPGTHNTDSYDLHSFGPDGHDGTEDDINNWTTP